MQHPEKTKSPSSLMSPPAAADYLSLSTSTLAKMRCKGTGPEFLRLGGAIKYTKAGLDDYLRKRTFRSTTEADAADAEDEEVDAYGRGVNHA